MVGTPGAAVDRYAPMPAWTTERTPVILPSLVAAISTCSIWSRPWMVAWKFSERVSVHFTGRPSFMAQKAVIISSA